MAVAVAAAAVVSCPRHVPGGGHTLLSSAVPLPRVRGCGVAVRARGQSAATPDPAAILRRPAVAATAAAEEEEEEEAVEEREGEAESSLSEGEAAPEERRRKGPEREWVDWEDLILEDTVPLVGFVRMILHSGKYENGDRLSPEHEKAILERLLPYHPQYEKKIGCGIDYITVGLHPEFENSRCLFIVRKDGEQVDFSFWKCVKGLIRQKYPLYADSFILRHFRRRQDYRISDS
uniref:Protein DCL, chloroplastic n=1 Tax=Leersia perrieri TaxID=77586 RepID=A0A0D9VLF5_9ORYZ